MNITNSLTCRPYLLHMVHWSSADFVYWMRIRRKFSIGRKEIWEIGLSITDTGRRWREMVIIKSITSTWWKRMTIFILKETWNRASSLKKIMTSKVNEVSKWNKNKHNTDIGSRAEDQILTARLNFLCYLLNPKRYYFSSFFSEKCGQTTSLFFMFEGTKMFWTPEHSLRENTSPTLL